MPDNLQLLFLVFTKTELVVVLAFRFIWVHRPFLDLSIWYLVFWIFPPFFRAILVGGMMTIYVVLQIRCQNKTLCNRQGTKVIITDLNQNNQTDFILSSRAFRAMAYKGMDQGILKLGLVDAEYKRWAEYITQYTLCNIIWEIGFVTPSSWILRDWNTLVANTVLMISWSRVHKIGKPKYFRTKNFVTSAFL